MNASTEISADQLAELRDRFPLPEGVPDADLNMGELAQFMGVSQVTVQNWLRDGIPVLQRGGAGREYVFRAGDVWAWKKSREAEYQARNEQAQAAIQAMRLQLTGGELGDSINSLTPKEKREVFATQTEYERFMAERHELLRRGEVVDALEQIFLIVRNSIDALPDLLAREAHLDNKQVAMAITQCDQVLAEIEKCIEKFFADRPKGAQPKARDLLGLQ